MTEQRRLAAILVADVVSYSKLVGKDEVGTLVQLRALQTEVIEPAIAKHAGRLFKAVGDGFWQYHFAPLLQGRRWRPRGQSNRPTRRGNCRCASASMSAMLLCRVMI